MKARRRAFTLVEVLTALTVLSVIFGTMLMTLHAMQKTSRQFTDGTAAVSQQQRFAAQLRVDAHQAVDASARNTDPKLAKATVLKLSLADDQVVEYRLFEDRIVRRTSGGESNTHQETFAVLPVLDAGWAIDQQRAAPLVTVHLHQRADTKSLAPSLVPLQVNAALRVSTSSSSDN